MSKEITKNFCTEKGLDKTIKDNNYKNFASELDRSKF
jgi:hypothetical protein